MRLSLGSLWRPFDAGRRGARIPPRRPWRPILEPLEIRAVPPAVSNQTPPPPPAPAQQAPLPPPAAPAQQQPPTPSPAPQQQQPPAGRAQQPPDGVSGRQQPAPPPPA